jgi:hypothetical protein
MELVLISTERQAINDRIRAHGLAPEAFAYRLQPSTVNTRYVRLPSRVLGRHEKENATTLYPKTRPGYFFTIERNPRSGFRSSFCPDLADESWTSVPTWQELMDLLDRWLDRLGRYERSSGRDKELQQAENRGIV